MTLSPTKILQEVASYFDISVHAMLKQRGQAAVRAKHIAIWLIREVTHLSFTEIGRKIKMDHSSILFASHRVEDLRDSRDPIVIACTEHFMEAYAKFLSPVSDAAATPGMGTREGRQRVADALNQRLQAEEDAAKGLKDFLEKVGKHKDFLVNALNQDVSKSAATKIVKNLFELSQKAEDTRRDFYVELANVGPK